MTRLERGFNPGIQHLHDEILLPYDSNLGLKFAKKRLIEHLGFTKVEGGFNLSRDFVSSEPETSDRILSFVHSEIEAGNFLTLRIIDDRGEKGGGYPVVYFLRPSDVQKYFAFAEDGSLQGFESTDGRLISLGKKLLINIFSREQSFECKMTGFNNYPGIKVARMGGGFRLQLSQLAFEDRKPVFRFSTVFTFDDVGPRSTSLSSHYDKCVPHVTTVVDLGYENRHFIKKKTSSHPETMGASIDARNLAHYVVDKLVENDGESLAILFLSLLEVSPLPGQHSIEGIFSFTKDDGGLVLRGPEVYDFDGLDTTSVWVKNKGLMVPEGKRRIELKKKFMKAQLRCIESRDTRKMRTLFQAGLRADLKSVVKSEDIILEIDRSVKNHFRDFKFGSLDNEKALGFTHKLTGPVALGRLLKYLTSIEWQPSENRYTSVYENKENKFIKVSVRGFDLAFWLKDETLIDTSNIRRMGTLLSKALGRQIVTAHFSYLREGD